MKKTSIKPICIMSTVLMAISGAVIGLLLINRKKKEDDIL